MFTRTSFNGFRSRSHMSSEARLCHVTPTEAMNGPRQLNDNAQLRDARNVYDNEFLKREYRELTEPQDRAYFHSLLIANMARDTQTVAQALGDRNRSAFRPFEGMPFLRTGGTAMPPQADLRAAGRRLRETLTAAQASQLDAQTGGTQDERDERLATAYFDARNRWTREWNDGHNIHDRAQQLRDPQFDILQRAPIELYRKCVSTLNDVLNRNRIDIPRGVANVQGLSRRDYVGLLALVWKGDTAQVEKAAATGGTVEAKLKALRALNAGAAATRAQEAYDRVAIEELGPTETLRTLDITPGNVSVRYIERRRGRQPNIVGPETPRNAVRSPVQQRQISEQQAFRTMDSAATWRGNPGSAIDFLNRNLPTTDGNTRFLNSLKFHFGTAEQRRGIANAPMNREDTQAALSIMIDMLLGHERIAGQSQSETEQLRKQLTLSETLNQFGSNMVEMVGDWQNNPVPAAIVAVGGIVALKAAWNFIRGDHSRIVNWATYGALGALAYGMYQERQTGSAWWTGMGDQLADLWRGDNALPPERRTYATYWAREIQMDNATTRKCLSLIQNADIRKVCGFYEDMRMWQTRGGSANAQPRLADYFDMTQNRAMFGQMTDQQIGATINTVLKGFFTNRGNALVQQGFQYVGQEADPEARGFAYIRDRYQGRRFFSRLVEGTIRMEGAEVDGQLIATWEQPATQTRLRELYEAHPRAREPLLALRAAYVEEQRTANQQRTPWQWWNVMLFEADPGALERMGREGTQPASFLRLIQRYATDTLHNYSPFEPGAPDRADRGVQLLRVGSAEHTLLTQNSHLGGGRFGLLDRQAVSAPLPIMGPNGPIAFIPNVINQPGGPERKVMAETLNKEWGEFLGRVPLTPQAREQLTKYMQNHIANWPVNDTPGLLNDIEAFKYRILSAAAIDSSRLSAQIAMNPPAPSDTNMPDWMRYFLPFEGERFPEINSLDDIRGLFDINVQQNGGVAEFNLWMRMFPRWEASQFQVLAKDIAAFNNELTQLRQLPDLALVGVNGPNGGQAIDNLNRFAARKIANRLVELSLYTLRADGTVIPDAANNRFVTPNEQASLRTYISTLRSSLIRPEALKRLAEFNQKADAVERQWQQGNLRVVVMNGQVRIVMNNGAALPNRFLTTQQYAALAPQQVLFSSTMSVNNLLSRTPADIVNEWRRVAVEAKQKDVVNALNGRYPQFQLRLNATGNAVRYGPQVELPLGTTPVAETPTHVLLNANSNAIVTRYKTWRDGPPILTQNAPSRDLFAS